MKIIKENDFLKNKCKNIDLNKGRKIARKLVSFLMEGNKKKKFNAVGIASNQVGFDASVAVVLIKNKPLILINPIITDFSKSKFAHEEECLSFPDQRLTVFRHDWVKVKSDYSKEEMFFGQLENTDINKTSLFESALIQHEIAHLFGKTIHDFQWENSPSPREW